MEAKPIIFAHIPDAYYFRNAISAAKSLVTEGNLRFDKKGISFSKLNSNEDVLVRIVLNADDMISYTFSPVKNESNDGDDSKEIDVEYVDYGISLDTAQKITKLLPKKGSAHI